MLESWPLSLPGWFFTLPILLSQASSESWTTAQTVQFADTVLAAFLPVIGLLYAIAIAAKIIGAFFSNI